MASTGVASTPALISRTGGSPGCMARKPGGAATWSKSPARTRVGTNRFPVPCTGGRARAAGLLAGEFQGGVGLLARGFPLGRAAGPWSRSALWSPLREVMPSFMNTWCRCHSTVRGLMNN